MNNGKMKRTSSKSKSTSAKVDKDTEKLNQDKIRVRMYRIGFGDCFLLSLPVKNGMSGGRQGHILIDCGVHGQGDIHTMEKVVQNIAEVTDKQLDIVIASHAHQDHISGFGKFKDIFTKFKIGEVWLPWTWDNDNKEALKLQERQAALTEKLDQHFQALADPNPNALNATANLRGNQEAIKSLKEGFGGEKVKVRYLKAGDKPKFSDDFIPGLSVRILGPPESEEFLAQMDPPKGQGYLRLSPNGEPEHVDVIRPFGNSWIADRTTADLRLREKDENKLQGQSVSSIDDIAFAIDQARNNESLVTLFTFSNKNLFFPGDAQYGNWRGWLEDERTSSDILAKINFFKIAHHGSHNATPKAALEKMSDGEFAAMVSTQSKPFDPIPHVPLMSRLNEKTKKRIVRSDWLPVEGAPKPLAKAVPTMPSKLPEGFSRGDLWFDYVIKV
jgi:beta-lactamase superfamily II metal-dependent hydrolase